MDDTQVRQLVDNYQPSPQTIEAMSHVRLVATVGPTAVGKTTIMKAASQLDPDVGLAIGETSRSPRPGEHDGEDFIFRTRESIVDDLKSGQLTQIVIGANGDLYCTAVSNFLADKTSLFPLIPLGVRQFRALPLKFFVAAFIVPESFNSWQEWVDQQAKLSGWTKEHKKARLNEAITSFEFAFKDDQIHFVLNDNIETAVKRLLQVAHGQTPDDEQKARAIAQENFRKLKNSAIVG